jgi:catechol 2,3-dioxygenase-like lactoylglutathione lyase family enzyme
VAVTRIDHVVLTVADLGRTVAWYRDVAQMRHVTFGVGRHALAFGEQKINLHVRGHEFEPHAARPTPGSADLCLLVDEAPDALEQRLRDLGVSVERGPVIRDGALGELTSSYLRDPDGNLVELSSYAPAAAPA